MPTSWPRLRFVSIGVLANNLWSVAGPWDRVIAPPTPRTRSVTMGAVTLFHFQVFQRVGTFEKEIFG